MRLVYVIDSLGYGGAERSLADLAGAMRQRHHDVEVVQVVDRGGLAAELEATECPVSTLVSQSRIGRIAELRRLIGTLQPDIVHTQLFEADLAGRIAACTQGVPVVSSLVSSAYGPEHFNRPGYRRYRVRAAQAVEVGSGRLVARFHAVSEAVKFTMSRRLLISQSRIDVIPRGRDAKRLGRATPERRIRVRTTLGVPQDVPVILAIARHEYAKGLDVLVEAVAQLRQRNALVLVAGSAGAESKRLGDQLRTEKLTERVSLLGSRDDIGDLLAAADVLVMPSRSEGLPGCLIEALALEVPIVATDIPPAREVVHGLAGAILVPVGDPDALADALDRTLIARPLTVGHRERFESRYTLGAIGERMDAFYGRVVS